MTTTAGLPGEVGLTLSRRPSQRQRHQEERRRHPALHPAVLQDGEETAEEAAWEEWSGVEGRRDARLERAGPEEGRGTEALARERGKKKKKRGVNEYEGQKAV